MIAEFWLTDDDVSKQWCFQVSVLVLVSQPAASEAAVGTALPCPALPAQSHTKNVTSGQSVGERAQTLRGVRAEESRQPQKGQVRRMENGILWLFSCRH